MIKKKESAASDKEKKVRIIPIGGLNGIGNNMTVFEYEDDLIIVDCGIMFPNDEMPGVDYIIPDFTYIIRNRHRVRGIVITHGHEDHIGAVPFLLQEVSAPIYATKLTLGLIQSRLEEKPPRETPTFVEMSPRDLVHIGAFTVEFIRVNHSIIDGVGLAIHTPVGTIIHSGDFKIDYTPVDGMVTDIFRLAEYGEKGVLLLMSDSTNAERKGYTPSESVLGGKLIDIFSSSKGRIIVATFASNIHRIQQVMDAAQRFNRKVVISGTTMLKNIEIANALGYLTCRDDLIVETREANILPEKRLVIICTGSQGEPMSALARMANSSHRNFRIGAGDTVIITASIIPGNERTVNNVINSLLKMGSDVYWEKDEDIHVSGHASQEELKMMISLVKPKFFMPIHGEYKHLKAHEKIAVSLKIKPSHILIGGNGDILELTRRSFEKTGAIELSMIFVDGVEMGDLESAVIKERQFMSAGGILFVTLVVSEGMLLNPPDLTTRGFVGHANDKILEVIARDIEEQAHKLLGDGASKREIVSHMKKHLKGLVYRLTRRNPLVEVQMIEV